MPFVDDWQAVEPQGHPPAQCARDNAGHGMANPYRSHSQDRRAPLTLNAGITI